MSKTTFPASYSTKKHLSVFETQKAIEAVKDIVRAGVRVFASVHASGADDLTGDFKLLKETFDCHVVLSDKPSVGHIEKIDLRGEN